MDPPSYSSHSQGLGSDSGKVGPLARPSSSTRLTRDLRWSVLCPLLLLLAAIWGLLFYHLLYNPLTGNTLTKKPHAAEARSAD